MEPDELLDAAAKAGLVDPEKGRAALAVYQKLRGMGAKFTFGEFLVDRGLVTSMALQALEGAGGKHVASVDTVGEFQLLELIGEGEHGAVFRALQKSLDRQVALKILSTERAQRPESVQAFLREGRATAKIVHPNVVQIFAAGSDGPLHYIAMELVDGGSARAYLNEHAGRMPEALALDAARQAAEGLHAAHLAGILHRDVKPDNLLFTRDGKVKVTDLGISQAIASSGAGDEGTFWGTSSYVAPEVVLGGRPVDARSDVYSLGATLYEMLTGAAPYQGARPEDVLQMHVSAPVPDPRRIAADLAPQTALLVRGMLSKDPAKRPATAQLAADAMKGILEQLKAPRHLMKLPPRPPYGARPGQQPVLRRPLPGRGAPRSFDRPPHGIPQIAPAFKQPMPRPPAHGAPQPQPSLLKKPLANRPVFPPRPPRPFRKPPK